MKRLETDMRLFKLNNENIAAIFPGRIEVIVFGGSVVQFIEVGPDHVKLELELDHPQRRYAFWKRASESDRFYTFKQLTSGYIIREHLGPRYYDGGWLTNQYEVTNTSDYTKIRYTMGRGVLPEFDPEARLLSTKKAQRWLKMMVDVMHGREIL